MYLMNPEFEKEVDVEVEDVAEPGIKPFPVKNKYKSKDIKGVYSDAQIIKNIVLII